jgi:hypothetical protein
MHRAIFVLALIATATLPSPARAQTYCANGSAAAEMEPTPQAGLQVLRSRCQPGAVVFFHPAKTGLIGMACDFTKSIVNTGQRVICVLRR